MQDKEKIIVNVDNLPIEILWESPQLKQHIYYTYNNNKLIKEEVIQLDKVTNTTKTICCNYFEDYCSTIIIENNNVEFIYHGTNCYSIQHL